MINCLDCLDCEPEETFPTLQLHLQRIATQDTTNWYTWALVAFKDLLPSAKEHGVGRRSGLDFNSVSSNCLGDDRKWFFFFCVSISSTWSGEDFARVKGWGCGHNFTHVCTDIYTRRAIHYCHSGSPHGSWAILVQTSGAKVGCWMYILLRNRTEKSSDTG